MANNSENFSLKRNGLFTSNFIEFNEASDDLTITPCPIMPHYNESRNAFFMNNSLENHGFHTRFSDLNVTSFREGQNESSMRYSTGILPRFDNFAMTHPTIQQNNLGGNSNQISHASVTFTSPPSGQNNAPSMTCGGTNHIRSSFDRLNNYENSGNTSRNLSRSVNKVKGSSSTTQCKKRTRFRFAVWTTEEEKLMDAQLLECTFLPPMKICENIAKLLPKKSIRDVGMRIQWLIVNLSRIAQEFVAVANYSRSPVPLIRKHEQLDNVWKRVEPSPGEDLSEYSFYLPDNPNDPDLLAIRKKFISQDGKRRRI